MKNATECAKQLSALLKKITADVTVNQPAGDDPIAILVHSFLVWETSQAKAEPAYKAIVDSVVDFNELRVCMPQEILEMIGQRYTRGLDRCQRLRAVLRDIYMREHAVSLDRLKSQNKREVRKFLDSLSGMVPYVAARVMLLGFGGHAIPVDDQLRIQLIEAGCADVSAENSELASWLERQIKAADGVQAHYALQAWAEENAGKPTSTRKPAKKRTVKKKSTTRKVASDSSQSSGQSGAKKKKTTKARTKKKASKAS